MLHETLEYLGIAFASSAVLIILSKIILQSLIRRPAEYYIAEEVHQEGLMLQAAGLGLANELETDFEGENIEGSDLIDEGISAEKMLMEQEEKRRQKAEAAKKLKESADAAAAARMMAEHPELAADLKPAEKPEPVSETEPEEVPVKKDRTKEYADIRKQLEAAYEASRGKADIPLTSTGKPRKPSMKMKKDELISIAKAMGIELPEKATKAVILDLIMSGQDKGTDGAGSDAHNDN